MKSKQFFRYFSLLLMIIISLGNAQGQTYLYENFENDGDKPDGWTNIKYGTATSWQYQDGGYSTTGMPGTGHPQYAKEGFYNALFHLESFSGERVKLVTPPIDLTFGIKPELTFWHAQDERYTFGQWRNDELRVFYREHIDSTWKEIAEYTDKVNVWTERTIQLPDSTLSSTYYIAFEATTLNGYGVCIDSVTLVEKGVIPKYVESIDIRQASSEFVATESKNNQILRIDFTVKGNDGSLKLDSLAAISLNTDDSDIEVGGVKLFVSNDNTFSNSMQVGTGKNFVDGKVNFTNINRTLPTGFSSAWLTYDIVQDVNHEKHEHKLDAMIAKDDIKINTSYYPVIDKSPDGERTLFESILYDDFETDKGWVLTGEFERDMPQGKGAINYGSPDPEVAVSGDYIIGTDLTGLGSNEGDYEFDLTDKEYSAASPYRNCKYYKDIYLYFDRWFNMDGNDTATIDINTKTEDNWTTLWVSGGTFISNSWKNYRYNIDDIANRNDSVSIRFTLGPTNGYWNYSGWNIDNVVLVGNYINKDVAITDWIAPLDGCGHTDEEYVTIKIKNLAGEPMDEPLPLSYSFDEGETIYYDTIQTTIPVDDSITYQIDKPIDLTTPGWYSNVYAKTHLPNDEDQENNQITLDIFITPTYSIPYTQNFELNYGYYLSGGANSTWAYGAPGNLVIDQAASGTKAWVTSLFGNYSNNDSSYLLSPCFNFGGADSIVFEFKGIAETEKGIDGLSLLYTLDEGENWNLVPNKHDFYWEWYNRSMISELGYPGIDSTNGEWRTFRTILPAAVSNQSNVKFQFVFESDEVANNEGIGIDDIKIFEAPYDVGPSFFYYPISQCELSDTTHVKVYIKNYGITDVKSGTKIPIKMKFKSQITNDTITLASDLEIQDSVLFTFNNTVNMSYAGDYNFVINTKLESNTYFYNDTLSNDTLRQTVTVKGMPRYNPFPNQIGDNPIDTFIVAGTGYTTYNWSGGNPDITPPQDTAYLVTEGWYKVTVTNAEGCTAADSVELVNSEIDFVMDSLYTILEDSCQRNDSTEFSVHYINKSFNVFEVGDTVLLGYQINYNPVVEDTMFITEELAVDDTAWFTYNQKADLTTPGRYTVKVFTNFIKDLNHFDDTITRHVNTNGFVNIDLNYDTVYSSEADTLEIIATPGYATYTWDPAGSNDTISPANNVTQWYKVTVTDTFACNSDNDSVYVETYDFGITDILGFVDDCDYNFTVDSTLKVEITNYSGNTYDPGDTIRVLYQFDNENWEVNTLTLTSTFNPSSSQIFDIGTINATNTGYHVIKTFTSASMDANHTNDTLEISFETWPYPNASLAYDTIFTTRADTVVLTANSGWDSYFWNTGETEESISVTKSHSFNYIVQVSDEHGCGIAEDSTQIITHNIGILDIIWPINDCEHTTNEKVRVEIENYSQDTFYVGDIIDVGYILNNGTPVEESYVLDVNLLPEETVEYQFTQKVDLLNIETYTFKVYTALETDVNSSNDTLIDAVSTYGYPETELGNDIYTTQPDTVIIVAEPGFVKYEWENGVENDSLYITYPATRNYSLTVTNTNGCTAEDSITVYTYDVAPSALNTPVSECVLSSSETVNMDVINNSQDTLLLGDQINVNYVLNSGSPVSESFTLTDSLKPGETVNYTFTQTADLSTNQEHQIDLFAERAAIDVETNDDISSTVDYLTPVYDLGGPVTEGGTEYTIDAGAGYTDYLWFDNSSTRYYTVDINQQNPNNYYAVTVTTTDGCEADDSIMVTFTTTADLSVTEMLSPTESKCWNSTEEDSVHIEITNVGVVDLTPGTSFTVGYLVNNGNEVTETFNLSTAMNANDTREHVFPKFTYSSAGTYKFKPFVKISGDEDISNDTLPDGDSYTITISQPEVDFVGQSDTVYFDEGDPFTIQLNGTYLEYAWSNGETTASITVTDEGGYTVTVTDQYLCQAEGTFYCFFNDDTGFDNIISGDGYTLSYYPNPTSDKVMVEFDNRKPTDVRIEIVGINGQLLFNTELKDIKTYLESIDVNSYANGIYYLRFRINGDYYTRKLIVQ